MVEASPITVSSVVNVNFWPVFKAIGWPSFNLPERISGPARGKVGWCESFAIRTLRIQQDGASSSGLDTCLSYVFDDSAMELGEGRS